MQRLRSCWNVQFDLGIRAGRVNGAGRLLLLAVLVFAIETAGAWAQDTTRPRQYVRTQWTAEDGLPVNSVNDIAQDADGYLWLATYDGLVRFDGLEFKVYRTADDEGLPSNRILRLFLQPDGLWMRTESRTLVRFHEGTFRPVVENVYDLREGPDGRLWVGTNRGVFVKNDGSLEPVAPEAIRAVVRRILVEEDGTLWVGTEGQGVYQRSPDGAVRHFTTANGLGGIHAGGFAVEEDGGILIGMWGGGLHRWDDDAIEPVPAAGIADSTLAVFSVETGGEQPCWAATSAGILRCRGGRLVSVVEGKRRFSATSYPHTFLKRGPEGHVWIAAGRTLYRDQTPVFEAQRPINVFEFDRDGILWVGTSTEGLFRLRRSLFTVYGELEGLDSGNIYPIEQRRDGSIWLGTLGGGLTRLAQSDVATYILRKGRGSRGRGSGGTLRNVWAVHEDRARRLWVGGSRLCQFADGRCARPYSDGPITGTRIVTIYEDRQRRLWVGTVHDGVYRCDSACGTGDGAWRRFAPQNSRLPSSYVRTIHETPGDTLWFGTNGGGIARYADGTFAPVTTDDGLSSNLIRDIYQDTTGTDTPNVLWIATEDRGLNRIQLSPADTALVSSVTVYRKQDGLYDNAVHQILKDDQGRFWISSNRGIFWVKKAELEAFARGENDLIHSVSYTTSEGLRSREANGGVQPAGLKAQDGRLWFPTQKGAVVVDPARVPTTIPPPPVHVKRVTSADSVLARQPGKTLRLAADQRSFDLEYTGINLANPTSVTYRYRLAGLQSEWRTVGKRRQAFFTNVPPGQYTFEVAAQVRGGAWSETPTQLTLTVAPYFYETWWFYGLCVLGVGLIGLGSVRYWFYRQRRRERQLRRRVEKRTDELAAAKQQAEDALDTVAEQAEQLRRLDEMKSRFFANVSHELRTPLSLILSPIRQMIEEEDRSDADRETLQLVSRNAERLQRLVEQLLDLARYDAGHLDLDLQRQEWGAFVEQTTRRFVPMAERRGVALSVQTETVKNEGGEPETVEPEEAGGTVAFDSDHMETVIANLVRNALKYTPEGGRVTVETIVAEDEASVRVSDTGPGIPDEERERLFDRFYRGAGQAQTVGTGIGLALTKALVSLHEGTIEVDSTLGESSTFTVRWPLGLEASDASDGSDTVEEETGPEEDGSSTAGDVSGDGVPATGELSDVFGSDVEERPATGASASPPASDNALSDRTTVLVVDDNADVRRYVRGLLEPRYRVIEAEHGRSGLEHARAALPDLIVADVMMPEMGGFEMVRALGQSDRTDCIPVVMLTARAEETDQVEGLEGGAEVYVTKPFEADVLIAQVDRLIATRLQLRERFQDESSSQDLRPFADEEAEKQPDSFETEVRAAIDAHLTDPDFSAADLAEKIGLARRTVSRKVKKEFGKPPSDLIRAARLERGAELLDDGTRTISEIAYAVGFNSLSYFSRRFKEHFGVSPSAYRKEG